MRDWKRLICCRSGGCLQMGLEVEQEAHVSYLPLANDEPGTVEVYRWDQVLCGLCDTEMVPVGVEQPKFALLKKESEG